MGVHEKSYWFDPIHDGCGRIGASARQLQGLSYALERIGMDRIADELDALAHGLLEVQENIRSAVGKEVSDSAREAEQSCINTVLAALAVATRLDKTEAA